MPLQTSQINKPDSIEQIDDIGQEDSMSQVSKTSPILHDNLKQVDKEVHNKRDECVKHL